MLASLANARSPWRGGESRQKLSHRALSAALRVKEENNRSNMAYRCVPLSILLYTSVTIRKVAGEGLFEEW